MARVSSKLMTMNNHWSCIPFKTFSLPKSLTFSFPPIHRIPFFSSFPNSKPPNFNNSTCFSASIKTVSNPTDFSSKNFIWDDVIHVGQSQSDSSDLTGFFHKVAACNRNVEKKCEFVPFIVEDQIVGYIHNGHMEFICMAMSEKKGHKFLWLGKRCQTKSTYPGMLDHLVARGLPHGLPCGENMMKECEEKGGIPISISKNVEPVGAISDTDIDGHKVEKCSILL